MTNFIKNLLFFAFYTLIVFIFINNSDTIISSVNFSINLFLNTVFPSLFPFFMLVDILNNYNYFEYFRSIIKFKYSDLFIVSIISGLPSNAKYLSNLINENLISKKDASILLGITFFPNPMFVIGIVSSFLGSKIMGIKLLVSLYLSSFIVFLLNYKKLSNINYNYKKSKKDFSTLLKTSILKNISLLVVIFGTILIFTILVNLLTKYLNINKTFLSIINLLLEMTSGLKLTSTLSSPTLKVILSALGLSFSGLSIIMQAFAILPKSSIDIKTFIKNKLLVIILNIIIISIIINI